MVKRQTKTPMHQSAKKRNIQFTEWRDAVEPNTMKMITNHLKPRWLQKTENHENKWFSKSLWFFVKFIKTQSRSQNVWIKSSCIKMLNDCVVLISYQRSSIRLKFISEKLETELRWVSLFFQVSKLKTHQNRAFTFKFI